MQDQLDDRAMMDLTERMKHENEELLRKTKVERRVAEKQYKIKVNERQYEVGDQVLVYKNEGDVAKGRKLRRPLRGAY